MPLQETIKKFIHENWIGLCVVLCVAAIVYMPFFEMELISRLLIGEGVLLFSIFGLYLYQVSKTHTISDEKAALLEQLKSRIAAIEASADGIAIMDRHENLTYINPAYFDLLGLDPETVDEYLGRYWLEIYSENARMEIDEHILPQLDTEQSSWQGQAPVSHTRERTIYTDMSLTRLPDGGLICTLRDVSEQQKIGREKENLEDQLYQAQKMEAIGRLAGGIAHDFNNILAAMNGYAEFLVEDLAEDTPQKQFASNILQAGRQARDLVDQMLVFSRQKQSAKQVVNLMQPLQESILMLQASFPKTIELETHFDAENTDVEGNATQISQTIMNLCVNAKDAMSDDHGVLTLEVQNKTAADMQWRQDMIGDEIPGASETPPIFIDEETASKTVLYLGQLSRNHQYVCLSVQDTGSGMSRVIIDNIFEPFFTTKPVDKGTGLGLSTVHGMLSAHSGALLLESEIGKGSKFTLMFPVTAVKQQELAKEIPKGQERRAAKILLVEDQDNVRMMTEQALIRQGYEVDCCEDGLEALMVLRDCKGAYDLVVTDHNMPKMTGMELIQQIYNEQPALPFILLSGYSEEKMRELQAEHDAVKTVLRKPISKEVLHATIQNVIAQHGSGRSIEAAE